MKGSVALLVSGLAAQQVAATWNRQATNYNTPQYNNNECSDKQNNGFDWSDLKDGDKDFNYGDFNFGAGWSCSNSFGKRDLLTKRTFNSKCVKNTVSKEKPASFSCDKRKDGFSVKEIDVSVDFDTDLEFHYKMGDGSTCKQTAPCKKEGTTVKNTQCGGAKSVEVYLGKSKESKSSCNIGFHNIRFDCSPGKTYNPPPPYTPLPPKSSSSSSASQPPKTSSAGTTTPAVASSSSSSTLSTATKPATTAPGNSTYIPSPPPAPPVPSPSKPASSSAASSSTSGTPVPSPPGATKPATEYTPGSSAPPAPPAASSSTTPAGSTTAPASSTTPAGSSSPSPPTYPAASPPDVLPKCLNTWLQINTQCKDNTDNSCYCKIPDFTKNVIDCVASYSTSEQAQKALQYFIGICAADIPKNPGIVSDCPSNIPINPAPPAAPTAPGATKPAPTPVAPGITPTPEVPAPAPPANPDVPCTTISVGSSTYTVPQVVFTTSAPPAPAAPGAPPAPGTPDEPIALVPGTPAPAPATTTAPAAGAPYPIPSGLSSAVKPTGTGAVRPSPPAQQFTGAASSLKMQVPAAIIAALAFFAL